MQNTNDPISDLLALIQGLPATQEVAAFSASTLFDSKPVGSDGALAGLATFLCRTQAKSAPTVADTHIVLLASSYKDLTPEGSVSAFVKATQQGAAPVNLLSMDEGLGLRVMDLATAMPYEPGSFTDQEFVAAAAYGMEATAVDTDVLGLGDATFGNDVFVAACLCALSKEAALSLQSTLPEPLFAAAHALSESVPADEEPLHILKKLGGRDIAAALGALISSKMAASSVLIEGGAMMVAYLVLKMLRADVVDHIRLAGADSDLELHYAAAVGLAPITAGATGAGPGASIALAHRQLKAAKDLLAIRPIARPK